MSLRGRTLSEELEGSITALTLCRTAEQLRDTLDGSELRLSPAQLGFLEGAVP